MKEAENMNKIKVSIICNTFNHEEYIQDALDSFVKQKTSFQFEILVHDDASTDNTRKIIQKYVNKYPNLIKPLYQVSNKYSQKINIISVYQYPRVAGEYIAFCEGDDYWIDEYKLQKQVNYLDSHPETDICAHSSIYVNANSKKCLKISSRSKEIKIFSVEDVISGGGDFVSTSSLMYRSCLIKRMPEFIKFMHFDYTIQIYSSLRGGMGYLPDVMSAYRVQSNNSWTVRVAKNKKLMIRHRMKLLKMLKLLNIETNYRYCKSIKCKRIMIICKILELRGKYKTILFNKKIDKRYCSKIFLSKIFFKWCINMVDYLNMNTFFRIRRKN
mgnify:CR=1 FL=1